VVTKWVLSTSAKLLVLKSIFFLILTCGHESWAMTKNIGVWECIFLEMQKIFAQILSCISQVTYKQ